MSKSVIIIGASGHGKVVADIILRTGDLVLGFLDDQRNPGDSHVGFPVLGKVEDYKNYPEAWFVIAIGNASARAKISDGLEGVRWYTAVHPAAAVSPLETSIGAGTVVMAGAVVNPGAQIGRHCIINSGSVVEHDNRIGDFVHISVGAKLAGSVTIGRKTWVGIGAVVSNGLEVCAGCTIGAGCVVVNDIPVPGTYVGVPARKLK